MSGSPRPFLARHGRTLFLAAVALIIAVVWLTRGDEGPRPSVTFGDALRQEGHQ